jgi:hypothetical protein
MLYSLMDHLYLLFVWPLFLCVDHLLGALLSRGLQSSA